MTFQFVKAERTKVKARMAIDGPTGSGKTYTGLIAATAFSPNGKIAVIDTEKSASLYADLFNFDVLELLPPYDPIRYVEAINVAVKAGYETLMVDSFSHEWEGEGGILDMVDQNAARYKGNTYAAWRPVTPKHRKLIDAIRLADVHIIATMRSKMAYEQEKNSQGKSVPKKIGLAPIQRSGTEYEFTWVIDMDIEHNAVVSKSRAADLADLVQNKPNLEWFAQFYNWLVEGKEPNRTKAELISYGKAIGLQPEDIGKALKLADIEWNPDPSEWIKITNSVSAYAESKEEPVENDNGHKDEEVEISTSQKGE
ncbi:MAG: ATP-binding protein [Candidatus Helarchaeota archaeon]